MSYTEKQKKAFRAAYGIKKRGGTPRVGRGMSLSKLREHATGAIKKKKDAHFKRDGKPRKYKH